MGSADSSIDALEASLRSSLRTIQPDPVFVGHLHERLIARPVGPSMEARAPSLPLFALLGATLMGLLFIWLYRRSRD
ncbi:MAG TPA: hypothetical protein PKL11_11720 [Anaerolineaceae bacterium]|nr:hypothetical protein [Anaerolineaceae bacterium]HOG79579.1 hypothetical protein [Anaerolineaceae bacterium]